MKGAKINIMKRRRKLNQNYELPNMYLDIDLGCMLYIFRRSSQIQLQSHIAEIEKLQFDKNMILTDLQSEYLFKYYKYCKELYYRRE